MLKYKTAKVGELMVNNISSGEIGEIVNRVYYTGMPSSDVFSLNIIDKRDELSQNHPFLNNDLQCFYPNEEQEIFLDFRKETIIHIKEATPYSIEYYVEQEPFER